MANLTDWQWALAALALVASLVAGGWINRQRATPADNIAEASPEINTSSELESLRGQLQAREHELEAMRQQLEEAREEAELTLLQLHQVQEELEHYFLKSRDLQQKLDSRPVVEPQQLAQLQRIKDRLLQLYRNPAHPQANQRMLALIQRQHSALQRFQRLHGSVLSAHR